MKKCGCLFDYVSNHNIKELKNMYEIINDIFKWKDCQHCGDEWEYQCEECEEAEEEEKYIKEMDNIKWLPLL